jgi:signal transduction histidine kinase
MQRRTLLTGRIASRIALATITVALLAIAIVAAGVYVAGGDAFTRLMIEAGESAEHAHEMFDASLTGVLAAAVMVATLASLALAVVLARTLGRPLQEMGRMARRIAAGDYAARVPREGPEELLVLADSFNQMAEALGQQEQIRRDFIVNAAHELRTPLANLQGYLEGLRDGVLTADRQTYVSLWEEADRLVRLARSLDRLAEGGQDGAGRAITLDLAPLLGSAVDLNRPTLEGRGISVEREWPERLSVSADPDHLAQVLANLLQNALRYTAEGGRITIRAVSRPDSVLVSIANTGEPIPASDLPHLFERFYRVDKSRDRGRGGAGIGLAIVKQLVEAAGGRVGAESTETGTRVWFSIPAGGGH